MIWNGWAMPDWKRLSWSDRLAWAIGSGFGSGFFPIAPGTVGSAVAAAILVAIMLLLPDSWGWLERLLLTLAMAGGGFAVGVWATGRMSTDDNPDPGAAVWDEFVGMWIAAIPVVWFLWDELLWIVQLPTHWGVLPWGMMAAFFAFRALDIIKPWPCRRLERRHGGWGIMLDDVAAGVWAVLLITAGRWLVEFILVLWFFYTDGPTSFGCC